MSDRRRILVVVAVDAEARAVGDHAAVEVVVGGIGRTNAACATTEAILRRGPFAAVLSMGIAGSLPGSDLAIGDLVVGRESVYVEEGLETPEGFGDMTRLGFPLGDFPGNRVPAAAALLSLLADHGRVGVIATVATCSGTDRLAAEVVRRTGAIAEAMEGAAVLHAARRQGTPALEVRAISNSTGERDRQRWEIGRAFSMLARVSPALLRAVQHG